MMQKDLHAVSDGLKLGMALQFGGMGPICLLLFQLASLLPILSVLSGVVAVTLVDGIYITISVLGIMQIVRQVKEFSPIYKKIVGFVIALIGLSFCLMVFSSGEENYFSEYAWHNVNIFGTLFVLNLLNPVAIVCYTGVFTAKVINTGLTHRNLIFFAFGTLCSTPIFLSAVVIVGHFGAAFFPPVVIAVLNLLVGLLLVGWGVRCIWPNWGIWKWSHRLKEAVLGLKNFRDKC
jgi:threonine/homoserine/homoserine lactone efflux protein